ncbi:MAG: hypothetical protein WC457_03860 [Patescibacteria group bacterium]
MNKYIAAIVGGILLLPIAAMASVGVGVGTGKIEVPEAMKAGLIYDLPSFAVINTGDEASEYGVSVEYNTTQPQKMPPREWLSFQPSTFYLEPGKAQLVQVRLTLPLKGAEPGEYFAYLEGHPAKKASVAGETSVGVAAATKLYFSVAPANFFVGVYYRLTSLYKLYYPWSLVLLGAIAFVIVVLLIRKFFSFNIGISVKKKEE